MKKIKEIKSTMMPLKMSNVDTDQIMPKQFLKRIERSGYGEYLFYDWRKDSNGNLNQDFPLNKKVYEDAKVLVAGPNFGTGSSREHAPWGLQDWGFDVVISSNFADIFKNNCLNIGLVPLEVSEEVLDKLFQLIEKNPKIEIDISIENKTLSCFEIKIDFDLDDFSREKLLKGQDQIDITLEKRKLIEKFASQRKDMIPSLD
mgnify:FL=1|tara:strand:- start:222 stop:827 length:606 start_codon:yes stop_codon:yes gene_type:complete